jgi:hypothetical protein
VSVIQQWGAQIKAKRQRGQQPKSIVVPMPPPYGGLNALSARMAMPAQDAIQLDNYFPRPGGVSLRGGSRIHTTGGMGGLPVQTLAEWAGGSSSKLIAAANGNLYDCSTLSATASSLASGYTSDQWQTVMFRGQLHLVNGADAPQMYNGSAVSAPAWTGPTVANLIQVNIYRSRMYFVEKNTFKIWYGGVDSVSGALTSFDMQSLFKLGGSLSFMATWTRDSGNGMDDLAVFVSDQGEVLVYQGAYPADPTWYRTGRYETLTPLGRRCFCTLGAELLLGTVGGVIPMSAIITLGTEEQATKAITFKINQLISDAAMTWGSNFGWQIQSYPLGNYVLLNVPVSDDTGSISSWQYVVSTLTGAWCRFLGQNAPCWALFNDLLYFGTGTGTVRQADYGYSDGSTAALKTNGAVITGTIQTSFQDYGLPGVLKRFLNCQPFVSSNGEVSLGLAMQVDYRTRAIEGAVSTNQSGSPWDTSPWDVTPWGDATQVNRSWLGIGAAGHVGSLRISTMTTSNTITFQGYNVMLEPGGPI